MQMNGMLSHTIYREPTHLLKIAQHYDVKHVTSFTIQTENNHYS